MSRFLKKVLKGKWLTTVKRNKTFVLLSMVLSIYLLFFFEYKYASPPKPPSCFSLPYNFSSYNIQNIVDTVLSNGYTTAKKINNISNSYYNIYDVTCAPDIELVVVVKSFVGHFFQRAAIRNTWGRCHSTNVKVVFVLGYSKLYEEIAREEYINNEDVIQFSFLDTYRNNTHKTIMSYDWIVSNCSSSTFVLFVDDDFYVNIPNILQFVHGTLKYTTDTMYGKKQCFSFPLRNESSKWCISDEEYPYAIYPTYLLGGSILTHNSVVRKLQIAFPFKKAIFIDDVYVGLVAHELNIKLANHVGFVVADMKDNDVKNSMSNHGYEKPVDLFNAWGNFLEQSFWEKLTNIQICNIM